MFWNSLQSRINETPKNNKVNVMINFDEVTGVNTQEHNPHWSLIPDHSYRIIIAGRSRLGNQRHSLI